MTPIRPPPHTESWSLFGWWECSGAEQQTICCWKHPFDPRDASICFYAYIVNLTIRRAAMERVFNPSIRRLGLRFKIWTHISLLLIHEELVRVFLGSYRIFTVFSIDMNMITCHLFSLSCVGRLLKQQPVLVLIGGRQSDPQLILPIAEAVGTSRPCETSLPPLPSSRSNNRT
jgi:hypothetical protein